LAILGLFLASTTWAAIPLGSGLSLTPRRTSTGTADATKNAVTFACPASGLGRAKKGQRAAARLRRDPKGCGAGPETDEVLLPYSFERDMKDVRKFGDSVVFKVIETADTGGVHANFHYQTM